MRWTDFVGWFSSPAGQRTIDLVILPALAILVAGVIAALIGRAWARALLRHLVRDGAASAVGGLVESARRASVWTDLTLAQQGSADRLAAEADVRLRLAPIRGTDLAATWAALQIESLRRRSVTLSRTRDEDLQAIVARLTDWLRHPRRAKRLFATDIGLLRTEQSAHAASADGDPLAQRRFQPPASPPASAGTGTTTSAEPDRSPPPPYPLPVGPAPTAEQTIGPQAQSAASAAAEAADQARGRHATGDPAIPTSAEPGAGSRPDTDADAGFDQPPTEPVLIGPAERPAASQPINAPRAVRAIPAPAPIEAADLEQDLDDYDDEALITRDIPLHTPSPVSAEAVRERTRRGDEAVRRQ